MAADSNKGLRDLCGRGMSTTSDVYRLPVDKQERERLSLQHTIWKLMMCGNGLYPLEATEAVEKLMKEEEKPMIMDVGSGSGAWAVDMARLYPQSFVLGIDLTESEPNDIPGNCSFLSKDVTTGLDEYYEKYDIVHTRCVVGHIVDPVAVFREFRMCLKPCGILLAADGNLTLYNEYTHPLRSADLCLSANNDGCSHMSGWMKELAIRKYADGVLPLSGDEQAAIVRHDEHFEVLGEKDYFTPIGWDGGEVCSPNGEEMSRLWKINLHHYLQSSKGNFISTGESAETVDSWIANVMDDVPPRIKTLFKYTFFWARKV